MVDKKYRAALISLGSTSSKWTYEAMKEYFEHVDNINIKDIEINVGSANGEIICEGEPLSSYDCIYAKGSFRYGDVLSALATIIGDKAYMPVSASAFAVGHDKVLSHIAMQQHKIPTPITYLSSSVSAAKTILKKINYPIIMKLPRGTQGKGVMVAESYASASSMLDTLEALRQPFLIQEFVDTNGEDLRVIVIGNRVVASMKRKAKEGEQRANVHQGGTVQAFQIDTHMEKVAVETAKAIGAEICAVDILESIKGPVVLEANLSPGLQGIEKATNAKVADKIAKYLFMRTDEKMSRTKEVETKGLMDNIGIKKAGDKAQELISNLDFRNNKILLPEIITKITKFNETDEMIIKAEEGKLTIKKFEL
ncbi:RimK family alpha-L-glutamate ligase [Candidatus Woesearchaeota archaeon]|nr:RimK family alpha-L-glutamate ligase [Candidatus Woesearchaeota archaeon]